jgi:glycosyltransferase involved in cell wall biosynthesis
VGALRRVLMTTDAVGGVWRYSADLAQELAARGVEVKIASLGPAPSAKQQQEIGRLVSAREYALEWMPEPWADVDRSIAWLEELAREFAPDVVHLNGYAYADAEYGAPKIVVAHSCVRSWWRAVHGSEPPATEWSEYERRVSAGLRAANAIVAPTRFMADAMAAEYGIPREQIRVIYNFSRKEPAGAGEKQELLLAAGRMWDQAKNLALLEAIRPKLDWPLLIAEGQLAREELDEAMARASIFIHPALYEPFGLAVLEAARARCALVLADIPSLRELWEGAAVFCDPRDEKAWLAMLDCVMRHEGRRKSLSEAAAVRAEQFRAGAAVQEYLKVYSAL